MQVIILNCLSLPIKISYGSVTLNKNFGELCLDLEVLVNCLKIHFDENRHTLGFPGIAYGHFLLHFLALLGCYELHILIIYLCNNANTYSN